MYPESLLSRKEEIRYLRHRARVAHGLLEEDHVIHARPHDVVIEHYRPEGIHHYFERALRQQEIKALRRGAASKIAVKEKLSPAYSNMVRISFVLSVALIILGLPTFLGSAVFKNVGFALFGLAVASVGLVLFRISVGAEPAVTNTVE